VKRRLCTFAVGLLLLLCVAAVALWGLGFFHPRAYFVNGATADAVTRRAYLRKTTPHFWKLEDGGTVFIDRPDRVVLITAWGEAERGRITHWPIGVSEGVLRIHAWHDGTTVRVPWTKNTLIMISAGGTARTLPISDAQSEALWQALTRSQTAWVASEDLEVLGVEPRQRGHIRPAFPRTDPSAIASRCSFKSRRNWPNIVFCRSGA
jgi:hypothetical protein